MFSERHNAWTHPSVSALASKGDPVDVITSLARQLVWSAVEQGWKGPPFDPFELAELRGIKTIPRDDIPDARIIQLTGGRLAIEFNPTRPRGRTRYSIAHELAHALFPDCGEQVRNRTSRRDASKSEWQLEMLCNIAAAEILMPTGTFPELGEVGDLSIDHLMSLRSQFDVSVEALLIRVVRLTSQPCFVFAASRLEGSSSASQYQLDYLTPSRTCAVHPVVGINLPSNSLVQNCTGVGFTNHGDEVWPGQSGRIHLECVGIPPYPGRVYPRVVGIGRHSDEPGLSRPTIKYVYGDATQQHGDNDNLLAFVVNNKAPLWGGGFARVVRKKWPEVQASFRNWAMEQKDRLVLGRVFSMEVCNGTYVAAMVAQNGYGPSTTPRIRYSALADCLGEVSQIASKRNMVVHMPRIGCGEAQGDWRIVSELVNSTLCGAGTTVIVYDLPGTLFSGTRPSPTNAERNA